MFFVDPWPRSRTRVGASPRRAGRVRVLAAAAAERVGAPADAGGEADDLAAPACPGTRPFAFGDAARTRGILEQAGFSDVALEPKTHELLLGKTTDDATAFAIDIGPIGALLRDAPESARATARAAIREVLAPRATPNGVTLGSAVWIVTGTRK